MLLPDIIDKIINDFDRQMRLYMEMEKLSGCQLDFLQQAGCRGKMDELNELLSKRQNLIGEINQLNHSNKALQQEAQQFLGIKQFSLSQLKDKLESDQYLRLSQILQEIEQILVRIGQADKKSEQLMKDKFAASRNGARANHNQASKAYNQAKKKQ
ncbi:MAG: hypothetical protein ABFC94_05270 [Syntrophomonas sp.]